MRRSRKPIVIGSRKSRLARAQAQMVGKALARLHPHLRVEYRWIESTGDRTPGQLAGHGGKGLFTRSIEDALLCHDADLAVHSLKDLPTAQTPGLTLSAVPVRGEFRDCLITRDELQVTSDLDHLPDHATLGTSSPRRAAQIQRYRPDLRIVPVRGNVETRLQAAGKATPSDNGATEDSPNAKLDAVMLAGAGLRRLGYHDQAKSVIDPQTILPAACQGAIAIQCRANDHVCLTRTLPLNDGLTSTAVHAERAVVAGLGATCGSPLAVLVRPTPSNTLQDRPTSAQAEPKVAAAECRQFSLQVRVLSTNGQRCLEVHESAPANRFTDLIERTIRRLREQGAAELLAEAEAEAND